MQLAPAPLNLSAETMQANSKTGRALYSKHARLWQGDSVMEADTIEMERGSRVLTAREHVRAVFVQAAAQAGSGEYTPNPTTATTMMREAPPKGPNLWHVTAGTLTYYDAENRAHLERNVTVQSTQEKIHAPIMDLYFTRASAAGAAATSTPAKGSQPAQQISRAVGSGGVTVEEGTRKATAERGEYTAADGKFVMSGGTPTIFDGSAGTTTGRKLTFFLADDTIIVDSGDGSRTLTKHRVE
jgi:lipopolysaccharide export system protein LptA